LVAGAKGARPGGCVSRVGGRTTAFIEVKTRTTVAALDLAIDDYRLRRVAAAVEAVSHRYARSGDDIRIDIILIAPRAWPRHLVNVWHA
jgi:putative endonuclease